MTFLHVKPMPGEPTVFLVEGHLVQCSNPQCGRLARRVPGWFVWLSSAQRDLLRQVGVLARVEKRLADGQAAWADLGQCRKCGAANERRYHRVDLAGYDFHGECGCEFFRVSCVKALERAGKAERGLGKWRCAHVEAARDYALDLVLRAHAKNGKARP